MVNLPVANFSLSLYLAAFLLKHANTIKKMYGRFFSDKYVDLQNVATMIQKNRKMPAFLFDFLVRFVGDVLQIGIVMITSSCMFTNLHTNNQTDVREYAHIVIVSDEASLSVIKLPHLVTVDLPQGPMYHFIKSLLDEKECTELSRPESLQEEDDFSVYAYYTMTAKKKEDPAIFLQYACGPSFCSKDVADKQYDFRKAESCDVQPDKKIATAPDEKKFKTEQIFQDSVESANSSRPMPDQNVKKVFTDDSRKAKKRKCVNAAAGSTTDTKLSAVRKTEEVNSVMKLRSAKRGRRMIGSKQTEVEQELKGFSDEKIDVDQIEEPRRKKYKRNSPDTKSKKRSTEENKNKADRKCVEEHIKGKKRKAVENSTDVAKEIETARSRRISLRKVSTKISDDDDTTDGRDVKTDVKPELSALPKNETIPEELKDDPDIKSTYISKRKNAANMKFFCDICGKGFIYKRSMTHHRLDHTATPKYSCQKCGQTFNHKGNFNLHISRHDNLKVFTCGMCNKGYVTATLLNSHVKECIAIDPKKHEDKKFSCRKCGKKLSSLATLRNHMVMHTDTLFRCRFCPKTYQQFSGRYRHENKVHTEELSRIKHVMK